MKCEPSLRALAASIARFRFGLADKNGIVKGYHFVNREGQSNYRCCRNEGLHRKTGSFSAVISIWGSGSIARLKIWRGENVQGWEKRRS